MRWTAIGTVDDDADAVDIGTSGAWLDVTLQDTGERVRARWGLHLQPGGGGVWTPPPRATDEVVLVFDGDPKVAAVVAILASGDTEEGAGSWSLPQAVIDNPDAVHVLSSDRLRVVAPLTVVASDTIKLGGDSATSEVARKFDAVSVGGLYDAAWVAWRTAMQLAGLPVPPLAVEGKITEGSSVTKSM